MRMKPCPVFDLLSGNAPVLMADHNTLRTREDRAIKAYMLTRTKRASGSARSATHTGAVGDSKEVTLSWTTKSDAFTLSLKQFDKNMFGMAEALANGFQQACMNILEDKESEAIAYLLAQKATQGPTGLKVASFNTTNDAYEVTAEDLEKKRVFSIIQSIMRQNYFSSNTDIIVDPRLAVEAEFLAAQGSGNATNWGYQFMNKNIVESVELSDSNYVNGLALAMPSGSVGALNWIPRQNREGYGDYNSYVGGFGVISFMGYQFAVHGYSNRADRSSNNGSAQDVVMEFEVSLDTSFNKAPLEYTTDRTDSVIMQIGQLS